MIFDAASHIRATNAITRRSRSPTGRRVVRVAETAANAAFGADRDHPTPRSAPYLSARLRGARPRSRCRRSARRRRPARRPGTSRPAAGCGRACGTARCRRCRWRAGSSRRPRRRRRRRSRSCRRPASGARGSATNGVANSRLLGPARRAGCDESAVRAAAQSRPPLPMHPVDLVGEQEQRGDRRGVVGLVLARVVDRGRQVDRNAGIQRSDAVDLGDPLERGRATAGRATARRRRRSSSAARSSRRRPGATSTGSPPAPRRGVDQHELVVGRAVRPARPAP